MSALPPEQMQAMRTDTARAIQPTQALAERWRQLHRSAQELAKLAQLGTDGSAMDGETFAARLEQAQGWQRDLAWQSVSDIDAVMQPGLTALRVVTSRGQDASAPALALWREFHAARESLLAILSNRRDTATA